MFKRGFTLVELVVVVGILGILASFVIVRVSGSQRDARDAKRKDDLKSLQTAVELYYTKNGSYPLPATGSGNYANEIDNTDYIAGVMPTYLSVLPKDPAGKVGSESNKVQPGCGSGSSGKAAYHYWSDGNDYKIYTNCVVENPVAANDTLRDPARCNALGCWAYAVYTADASTR